MGTFDLKKFLGNINLEDFFTSIGSGYGRRFAEPFYDKIAEMPFFQKLKQKDNLTKAGLEAFSNTITAFLDQKIDDASPIRKLFKEIFMDSSSELNKRLLNGEPAKKILAENADKIKDSVEQDFLAILLMMDDEKMTPFLEQLILMKEKERADLVQMFAGMTHENMAKLAGLSQETRAMVFELMKKPVEIKKENEFFKGALIPLKKRLQKRIDQHNKEKGERHE